MTAQDDYVCWWAALAGQSVASFERRPHCGFWRKGKSGDPVAVWRANDGSLVAKIGTRAARPADAEFDETVFGFCLPNPITHEAYTSVMNGGGWPSTDRVVQGQIGDNSGAAVDIEMLRDQIAAAVEQAKGYASVTDDATAARAQSLRARLLELAGEVKERHRVEKAPHLKAGREVDAKWLPLAREADGVATAIRAALSRHETAKAQISGAPRPPAAIRGGYGRAAGVRVVKIARVIDQDAAYMALRDNAEVVALIKKIADKVIATGATLPGVKIEEIHRVA